jgi:hypothetical protein
MVLSFYLIIYWCWILLDVLVYSCILLHGNVDREALVRYIIFYLRMLQRGPDTRVRARHFLAIFGTEKFIPQRDLGWYFSRSSARACIVVEDKYTSWGPPFQFTLFKNLENSLNKAYRTLNHLLFRINSFFFVKAGAVLVNCSRTRNFARSQEKITTHNTRLLSLL